MSSKRKTIFIDAFAVALACVIPAVCTATETASASSVAVDDLNERIKKLEEKGAKNESAMGNVKFNLWGRYMLNTYSDIPATAANKGNNGSTVNLDSQMRYKLRMSSQLQENVWAYSVIGQDTTYDSRSASNTGADVGVQKMFTKIRAGDWYFNIGRQGVNESDVVSRLGTGLWMAASTGFDGVSVNYKSAANPNNQFLIGKFNRTFGSAVRDVTVLNANFAVNPSLSLTGTYFSDGSGEAVIASNSSPRAEISTIGAVYKFGTNNVWTVVGEAGRNARTKDALAAESQSSLYSGNDTGYDILLKYSDTKLNEPGTWSVSADYREFNPGFASYSGTEWIGGVLSPSKMGITGANTNNVKGVGVYFDYVPYKNIYTQVSVYSFAPISSGTTDGRNRQGVRFMIDYNY